MTKRDTVNPPILRLGNLGMERGIIFQRLCEESEGDETMDVGLRNPTEQQDPQQVLPVFPIPSC